MHDAYLMFQAKSVHYWLVSGQVVGHHGFHSQALHIPFQPVGAPSLSCAPSMSMPQHPAALGVRYEPYKLGFAHHFHYRFVRAQHRRSTHSALAHAARRRPARLLNRAPTAHPRRKASQRRQYASHRPVRQPQCPHQRHQRPDPNAASIAVNALRIVSECTLAANAEIADSCNPSSIDVLDALADFAVSVKYAAVARASVWAGARVRVDLRQNSAHYWHWRAAF